jgi:hypothetical protein
MTRGKLTHRLALLLGLLYVAAGVAETIRLVSSGDGGLLFWFGSLVGGGALVLLGEVLHRSRPGPAAALICVGCFVTVPATIWTVLVPVLALVVCILALLRMDADASPASLPGPKPPAP